VALRRVIHDEDLREDLARRGFSQRIGEWSESEHLHRYFDLIGRFRQVREGRPFYRPHRQDASVFDPLDPVTGERGPFH